MKLQHKLITLLIVLALALASFGLITGVPAAQSENAVALSYLPAPAGVTSGIVWVRQPPVNQLNVSWNG